MLMQLSSSHALFPLRQFHLHHLLPNPPPPPAVSSTRRPFRASVAFNRKDGNPNPANKAAVQTATPSNRNHKLYPIGCRGGDLICITRTWDNKAAYLAPLRNCCLDPTCQDVIVDKSGIHDASWERAPADPENYKEDSPTKNGRRPRCTFFFSALGNRNTKERCKTVADNIIAINNHPTFQETHYFSISKDGRTKIQNKIFLEFGADLTPQGTDELPYLSEYCTIPDLLLLVSQIYRDEETLMEREYQDLWNNKDTILCHFFSPDLLPRVGKAIHKILHPKDATTAELKASSHITAVNLD